MSFLNTKSPQLEVSDRRDPFWAEFGRSIDVSGRNLNIVFYIDMYIINERIRRGLKSVQKKIFWFVEEGNPIPSRGWKKEWICCRYCCYKGRAMQITERQMGRFAPAETQSNFYMNIFAQRNVAPNFWHDTQPPSSRRRSPWTMLR